MHPRESQGSLQQRKEAEESQTRRQGGAALLALRTEQGARSREMHMASRGKKSQRNGFLQEPPGRTPTCHHHDFSSVSPVLESCTDCEIINVCSCKLLSWGKSVTVIIKNSYWGRQRGKGESSYYREEGGRQDPLCLWCQPPSAGEHAYRHV